MKGRLSAILLVAVLGVQVFILKQVSSPRSLPAKTEVVSVPASCPENLASAPVMTGVDLSDKEFLRASIREVLTEELQRVLRDQQNETTMSSQAAPAPEVNAASFSQASAIMDSAISYGKWTEADSLALMPHSSNLTQSQRITLLEKFTEAVNQQRLEPINAPPL